MDEAIKAKLLLTEDRCYDSIRLNLFDIDLEELSTMTFDSFDPIKSYIVRAKIITETYINESDRTSVRPFDAHLISDWHKENQDLERTKKSEESLIDKDFIVYSNELTSCKISFTKTKCTKKILNPFERTFNENLESVEYYMMFKVDVDTWNTVFENKDIYLIKGMKDV